MSFKKLTDSEIQAASVSSLPTRPNADTGFGGRGYTPAQMKAAFDKLPKLLAERYNALVDEIEGGNFGDSMNVLQGGAEKTLQSAINSLDSKDVSINDSIANVIGKERLMSYEVSDLHLTHGWNTITLFHIPVKNNAGEITNLRTYINVGELDQTNTTQTIASLTNGLPYTNWGVAKTFVNARQNQVFRPFDDVFNISKEICTDYNGYNGFEYYNHKLKISSFKLFTLTEDNAGTVSIKTEYNSDSQWDESFRLRLQGTSNYIVESITDTSKPNYETDYGKRMDQTVIFCNGGGSIPTISPTDKSIELTYNVSNGSFFQWTHNASWSKLYFPSTGTQPEMVAQSFDIYFDDNFPGLRLHSDCPYAVIVPDGRIAMVNSARPLGIEVSRIEMDLTNTLYWLKETLQAEIADVAYEATDNSRIQNTIAGMGISYNAETGKFCIGVTKEDTENGGFANVTIPALDDVNNLKGLHLVIDNTNFTIELQDASGTVYGDKIDLPLETVVVDGSYADGTVTLTLTNGSSISFDVSSLVSGLVAETRTINGKPLTADITLTATDIEGTLTTDRVVTAVEEGSTGIPTAGAVHTAIAEAVSSADINTDGLVPTTRTINGKALSADITLTASDVGAMSALDVQDAIDTAIDSAITTALNTEV